jgi:hypothetical protein
MQAAGPTQQRETQNINSDLSQLTTCLHNLWRCQHEGATFVPSRQSPLTRILGKMLNGQGHLAVMLHISMADEDAELSRRTLEFGTRLLDIRTAPRRNDFRPVTRSISDFRRLGGRSTSTDDSAALCIQIGSLQADLQTKQAALAKAEAATKAAQAQLREEKEARQLAEGLCQQAANEAWRFANALKQAKKEAKAEQARSRAIATQAVTMHQLEMAGVRERLEAAQSEVAALQRKLQMYCEDDVALKCSGFSDACTGVDAMRPGSNASSPISGAAAAEPDRLASSRENQAFAGNCARVEGSVEGRHARADCRDTLSLETKTDNPGEERGRITGTPESADCLQAAAEGSVDQIQAINISPHASGVCGGLSHAGTFPAEEIAGTSCPLGSVAGLFNVDATLKRRRLRTKRTAACAMVCCCFLQAAYLCMLS